MRENIKALRGMSDILPHEALKWQYAEAAAKSIFAQYGYEEIKTPIIVDAGLGRPSDACECMEMGCAAVLLNTAIAISEDPVNMAKAFDLAVRAGRLAYLSGMPAERKYASASSPLTGFLRRDSKK